MAEVDLGVFLKDLEAKLGDSKKVLRLASLNLAEEAIDLIKQGFEDEQDPYGDPWKPKRANDGRKTLSGETGRLRTGWKRVGAASSGFTISPSVEYAVYHQDPQPRKSKGERALGDDFSGPLRAGSPRRMMIPDEDKGLPKRWSDAFEEAALDVIAAHFGTTE